MQLASGFDFFSRHQAFLKTIGELIERTLWNDNVVYWKRESVRTSIKNVARPAIDVHNMSGFSEEQRKDPLLTFDERSEFLWSKGVSLVDNTPVWIPAQLVSARYAREIGKKEPLLRMSNSNGLATHTSFEEAAYHGLLELIERDTFMITFFNRISPSKINPASVHDERAQHIFASLARYKLSCEILLLPTDMPTTVACCIVRDKTGIGPALAVGAKAHHDVATAIVGALTESFGVWYLARRMGIYQKPLPPPPWDTFHRLAFWGKHENTEKLSWLWSGSIIPAPPSTTNASTLQELMSAMKANKCTATAVSMSPPELQKLGFHAVCVVSPELQPLSLDSEPSYLGGIRLKSLPPSLGYKSAAVPPYPHPFP